MPVVESSRNANGDGRSVGEFKLNWYEVRPSSLGVIVFFIVFHN